MLQLYACLFIAIDGRFQEEMCALALNTAVNRPDEVVVTSVIPQAGIEFDPRPYVGTDKPVSVAIWYAVRPRNTQERAAAALKATADAEYLASFEGEIVDCSFLRADGENAARVRFTVRRKAKSAA